MKQCSKCKVPQEFVEFRKRAALLDGYASICKTCNKDAAIIAKDLPSTLATNIHSSQRYSSKLRKHTIPNYTNKELLEWLLLQPTFSTLHKQWIDSGHDRWLRPSCDRLDDYKPYTLDNLRLVTWIENKDKYHTDSFTGINTKQCTSVIQIDKITGIELATYVSVSIASRISGVRRTNISQCLTGNQNTAGGYIWKYL